MRIVGNPPSGGKKPTTPTIGTASDDGTGTGVSVAFTPSTYIGKSTITYTATSSPGSLTGTGSGSPITVSGLTTGTAYTFTVTGNTAYGVASDASAASNSVTPASPSSFESISTVTGNNSATSLTLSSIPSGYKSLQIRITGQMFDGGDLSDPVYMRFNGDTGNSYAHHILTGDGTTASASGVANANYMRGLQNAAGSAAGSANMVGVGIIDIIDYTSTSKNKTVRSFTGIDRNNSSNSTVWLMSSVWLNTSAVTSITLYSPTSLPFSTNTKIALYGIK